MSFGFEQHHGLILVNAILQGPKGKDFLRLALDSMGCQDSTSCAGCN
jgi:hypothetical protein